MKPPEAHQMLHEHGKAMIWKGVNVMDWNLKQAAGKVLGLGKKTTAKLTAIGISTVKQIRKSWQPKSR
ncbi:MAG: hypothetical protein CVV03_05170 [Firmicutes bacterium HGW-Firmicutes-8]|nr:MAG: hypothetical protein CVV03_05170 [Firmicutes bacterium HGW-Firmicutes-8]